MGTLGLFLVAGSAFAADPAHERFETKIRPMLVEHCIKCHGPSKQSSGFRVDTREALMKGGDTEGPALVPGNPDASPLVKAMKHVGDVKMPPKTKLPDPMITELTEWVRGGAPWPEGKPLSAAEVADASRKHWSFQPVNKPAVPPTAAGQPAVSPIDALVNAEVAKHGLKPAGKADRVTLLRRASFDLIGLPPTSEEIDAFVADTRADKEAFAAQVERLLASPHYGERWGRFWLDVARYADTKGYVFQEDKNYPFSYTYRDWVVEAFNSDLPYDQFVMLQIAADKLPHGADNRTLAALGFLTVGRRFLQDQNEIIDDRIDVVTRGLQGLSVACARCHDHKFDPIPTDDYYSLYGVFASSEEPKDLPLIAPPGSEADRIKDAKDYDKKIAERKKARDEFLAGKRGEIDKELKTRFSAYLVASEQLDFNPRSPKFDEVTREASLRPELLRRVMMRWRERITANDPRLAPWNAFSKLTPAEYREKSAEVIRGPKGKPSVAPASLVRSLAATPVMSRGELAKRYGDILARAANTTDKNLDDLRAWMNSPESPIKFTDADLPRMMDKVARNKLRTLEKRVTELDAAHPGAPARAMVMVDKAQLYNPHVFIRGNQGRPGKAVPRQFLKVLSPVNRTPFANGSGRLDLAKSIANPQNPLTARVMMNRVWLYHFGQGIVKTPSDFGIKGDPPSNPALLDWLAASFVENRWSIKTMHRMIMATDVYQRSSEASSETLKNDPTNIWLSHQNRRRLDFEAMRDALLASSGRLDSTVGGKPVVLEKEPFPTRRTMYGYIDRYNLEPVYRTFDFPNPDSSSPRRAATIVPQQALYLLNSPFVVEQARQLAARPDLDSGNPDDRIRHLYHSLFGREPDAHEVAIGTRFLNHPARTDDPGPQSPWSYGFGGISGTPAVGKPAAVEFHPFGHWTGKGWQLEAKIPTASGNFASVNEVGGHPGPDAKSATIIRWTAPADLEVAVSGALGHPADKGDGVRARVVSSRNGLLGSWNAKKGGAQTNVDRVAVKKGDTLDFVLDCVTEPSFDSYNWEPAIRVLSVGSSTIRQKSWNARAEFHGPEQPTLTPWESYVQALLLSNEFLYVD